MKGSMLGLKLLRTINFFHYRCRSCSLLPTTTNLDFELHHSIRHLKGIPIQWLGSTQLSRFDIQGEEVQSVLGKQKVEFRI